MTCRTILPSGQIVFDPRGELRASAVKLAPRPQTLRKLRLGVLDNSKWNASRLLRHTVEQLDAATSATTVHNYTKASFSRLAPEALLNKIAAETDVVVTAIGD